MQNIFDVCVVGSGPGGGIATYVLANAGLRVALVEAGRQLRAGTDYNAHQPVHEHLAARLGTGRGQLGAVTDFMERDHFTAVGDRPAHGLLRAVGGRSLCWAGHSLRFGPGDFKRWPIAYEQVAPYYARAERLMGVSGYDDGLWNLPDGEFLPGVPLRCADQMLRKGVERLKQHGARMAYVAQRKAIPTRAIPGLPQRMPCHYCGHCMAGCEVESKYTSANTPIPLALATGNLTLFAETMMTRILLDGNHRVSGIEAIGQDGRTDRIRCRALVLACSAVETARHLLVNRTGRFDTGLANSSGHVGRNLTSHFGVTVTATFPQLRNRDASNDDGTDYYHGLLTGLYWDTPSRDFDGTYQVQVGSGLHPLSLAERRVPGVGVAFKRRLREVNVTHAAMNMQGSLAVSPRTYVDLDPSRVDRFGVPLPRLTLGYGDSDVAMARDMVATCEAVIAAAGGEIYASPRVTADALVIDRNHWVGTTRMGTDPPTSVVTPECQTHDVANLYIGDASVFPAYPEKNPTLTNIALSWRMADHLAERFRGGDL
jgi:choline dehydrogenase-like flavoprotein